MMLFSGIGSAFRNLFPPDSRIINQEELLEQDIQMSGTKRRE